MAHDLAMNRAQVGYKDKHTTWHITQEHDIRYGHLTWQRTLANATAKSGFLQDL